jgi:hypothetical protein
MRRFKKNIEISMGYIFVIFGYENTTSCGFSRHFQNFDVHNLFIELLSDSHFKLFLMA